jgi:glutamyl-tRNA synthetase
MKTADRKLSKADGDTSIGDLREKGLTAADVIGRAAALAGLIDRPRPVTAAEVPGLFTSSIRAPD